MKTIHFISGATQKVSQEVVNTLCKRIVGDNTGIFQIFNDKDNVPYLVINLTEITHIS